MSRAMPLEALFDDHNAVAAGRLFANTMKPAVVVDLLDDSSDDDVKVQGVDVLKKENKGGNRSITAGGKTRDDDGMSVNKLGTAKTPAAIAAMKRASQNGSSMYDTHGIKPEMSSNLFNLSVAELKRRLTKRGVSFQGCVEKADLVSILVANGGAEESDSEDDEDPFASINRDPFGPLQDNETIVTPGGKYKIKRTGQVYYCTCLSWKFQRKSPAQGRTCKHIDELRADCSSNHVSGPTGSSGGGTKKRPSGSTKASGSNKKKTKISNDDKIQVTLADTYKPDKHHQDGWFLSEKLDGMRCVWYDGKLWSRNGNEIPAPTWFTDALPTDICLDGELFLGRGQFQELMSMKGNPSDPRWNQVKLVVFDAPKTSGDFSTRLHSIEKSLKRAKCPERIAYLLEQTPCRGKEHVEQELERIVQQGGEGVMLRNPKAPYEHGRTKNLLKYKRWHDAEATVVGYVDGKGKHIGRLGALKCVMIPSGKEFKIGTGFKDTERQNHLYPIGSTITYSYAELTNDGLPRFPKYLRERPHE